MDFVIKKKECNEMYEVDMSIVQWNFQDKNRKQNSFDMKLTQ